MYTYNRNSFVTICLAVEILINKHDKLNREKCKYKYLEILRNNINFKKRMTSLNKKNNLGDHANDLKCSILSWYNL